MPEKVLYEKRDRIAYVTLNRPEARNAIDPETQDFMAQRMKATLRRLDVDHTPIATAPDRVVELLLEVGKSVSA